MYRFLSGCLLTLVVAPAFSDDKPKPDALTPNEIADGWILLFDGETKFGWKLSGTAEVKDGVLKLGGGQKATVASPTTGFAEYDLQLETTGGAGEIAFESANGTSSLGLPNQPTLLSATVRLRADGSEVTSSIKAGPGMVANMSAEVRTKGPARLRIEVPGGGTLPIKSAKLRPVGAKPLFTGKDLEGWKVNAADPKRMATKFAVTKDGELSVKNGPGDLVTEKEFDNFVLQFECKTLGKGLNSGIFFRCISGQYQNGYEAQIQNAYRDNDRTKPVDFGTGAIYRRIPARRVVSNDNEWFTMTVVANGKHMATWVNGYQTVDWTDERKGNDNPRQGYRAAKGPLSIQGHDKTTDLLFKNIRIAELPGK